MFPGNTFELTKPTWIKPEVNSTFHVQTPCIGTRVSWNFLLREESKRDDGLSKQKKLDSLNN
jgi:hypothetical protein